MGDLIEELEPTYRLPSETDFKNSQVSEMPKEDLLELLEDSQVNPRSLDIQELEHDEAVSDWIAVVRTWLEAIGGGQAELFQVIEGTAMSPVMVWLALLLGGFQLEQQGDFYQGVIRVRSLSGHVGLEIEKFEAQVEHHPDGLIVHCTETDELIS